MNKASIITGDERPLFLYKVTYRAHKYGDLSDNPKDRVLKFWAYDDIDATQTLETIHDVMWQPVINKNFSKHFIGRFLWDTLSRIPNKIRG